MYANNGSSGLQASDVIPAPPLRRSLHEAGMSEAQRHKWIESEKAGRDLGDWAMRSWFRHHWPRFVRQCWVEHLEGRVYWNELDHGDFGIIQAGQTGSSSLEREILRRIKVGGENLDILCWSHEHHLPCDQVWKVLELLERLDINAHRVECRLQQAG